MSKKQKTTIPLSVDELSDLVRKIVTEVIKESSRGMKTQALVDLENHAYSYLWPNPLSARHLDASTYDFNTEIEVFHTKLLVVFEEFELNKLQCFDGLRLNNYTQETLRVLRNIREHVNQFFRAGALANNDYNKKLQQIETDGVSEDPESGLTPTDSISETKLEFPVEALALYLNKICIWAEGVFAKKLKQ